ncbi:hypothetical protein CHC34_17370 [Salmonella enterica]|uniref:Uncharacterized protein n=1 Tax=Salmonella enterica TaxID=28901 RepID=A0A7U5YSG1_SALER|nr:hypothetical protein CHC34_17370 [Salmonella enterica]
MSLSVFHWFTSKNDSLMNEAIYNQLINITAISIFENSNKFVILKFIVICFAWIGYWNAIFIML